MTNDISTVICAGTNVTGVDNLMTISLTDCVFQGRALDIGSLLVLGQPQSIRQLMF